MKIIIRILAIPFVFCLIGIKYNITWISHTISFIRYGGEWVNYEKDSLVTIKNLLEELKKTQQ